MNRRRVRHAGSRVGKALRTAGVLHSLRGTMRPARRPSRLFQALAISAAVGTWPATGFAIKTDLVILHNGDRITGEVKGLSYGKLDYSTDDAGRLSIEWLKVTRISSPSLFQLETTNGLKYLGRLGEPAKDGQIVVISGHADTLLIENVVEISPISASFLQRLQAYLDIGLTLAKANQATTFSLSGAAEYRGPSLGTQFKFDSYAQGQESVPTTTRNTVRQSVSWYLPQRWSAIGLVQVEQNDELDLDHRFTGGGGMERTLVHSNGMELSAAAGAVVTREEFGSAAESAASTNFEGLVAVTWSAFRFDSPKLDFSLSFAAFPSFSDWGRLRGQSDLRLKYELFKDFNAGILFADTFDSRPPGDTASKNDYVTTLTVGWSYRR
jgi:hypothetical protein